MLCFVKGKNNKQYKVNFREKTYFTFTILFLLLIRNITHFISRLIALKSQRGLHHIIYYNGLKPNFSKNYSKQNIMTTLIFYATFFGVFLGVISGRIYMQFVPEMKGQLLPTWLFSGIMAAVITFLISVTLSIVFMKSIEMHLTKLIVIAIISSELLLVLMMYKSVQDK